MNKIQFKKLLNEAIESEEQNQIDTFLNEFSNFDLKEEKEKLKRWTRHLEEYRRHSVSEMFQKKHDKYTNGFWKLKENIKSLEQKINKYESTKDFIDTLARKHSKYVFHKHGKIV